MRYIANKEKQSARAIAWHFNFMGIYDERKKLCLEKQIVL